MEFIVSNEEIEGTKTFKKVEKMFQNMLLKLSNRRTISQGLISFRLTGVVPGSIAGNNLRVLKDLIELETNLKQAKMYKEIEFGFGNIESAVKQLEVYKLKNELVFGVFNGIKLYSDVDDLDSAYKNITGKTKAEFDKAEQKRQAEYQEQKRKHEEAIPELTKEWIEKGGKILDKKYLESWNKCVPIRLSDLYQGMELGNCLEIVEQLNKGSKLEEVKPLIENQGHSGMSFGLVCSMVKSFCDRGGEFVSFVR